MYVPAIQVGVGDRVDTLVHGDRVAKVGALGATLDDGDARLEVERVEHGRRRENKRRQCDQHQGVGKFAHHKHGVFPPMKPRTDADRFIRICFHRLVVSFDGPRWRRRCHLAPSPPHSPVRTLSLPFSFNKLQLALFFLFDKWNTILKENKVAFLSWKAHRKQSDQAQKVHDPSVASKAITQRDISRFIVIIWIFFFFLLTHPQEKASNRKVACVNPYIQKKQDDRAAAPIVSDHIIARQRPGHSRNSWIRATPASSRYCEPQRCNEKLKY